MVSPEYRKKVLKPLNDRFCLAEACLLADVVQHLQTEAGNKAFHPRYRTYRRPVFFVPGIPVPHGTSRMVYHNHIAYRLLYTWYPILRVTPCKRILYACLHCIRAYFGVVYGVYCLYCVVHTRCCIPLYSTLINIGSCGNVEIWNTEAAEARRREGEGEGGGGVYEAGGRKRRRGDWGGRDAH